MTPKPPTAKLADLLNGHTPWDDADPSIQSWARFFIYKAASGILALPDKETRQAALGKLPGFIRPRVEDEIMRLWKFYRDND